MGAVDVRAARVSKRYRVRRAPRRWTWRAVAAARETRDEFWAVRDVDFEIPRGETLGIVGANGAGKSTILKLLGGITAPTEGEITIVGRLAALIEIGSGFHPELTGRENVFLSGAILGMRRRDIAARLDSIAAFSGVERFLDTPVKFYSSGMYVRLGFSVAAHLEPDVLLVDEVLAVGDAEFQARCLQRITELKRRGVTMIVVSHDLGAVEQLSDRAILMEGGRITASGPPHTVIARYQALVSGAGAEQVVVDDGGDGPVRVAAFTLHGADGGVVLTGRTGEPLVARVTLDADVPFEGDVALSIYEFDRGTLLTECRAEVGVARPAPGVSVDFIFPSLLLAPGAYTLGAMVTPAGAARAIAWRFGRTTLYVEGGGGARGVFAQPYESRVTIPPVTGHE